jgi:hypothetical protein
MNIDTSEQKELLARIERAIKYATTYPEDVGMKQVVRILTGTADR